MLREMYSLYEAAGDFQLAVYLDESPSAERGQRRQHEQAATVYILERLLGEGVSISHDDSGAPTLDSHPQFHLSISHSGAWYAVALQVNGVVGIDVQEMKAKKFSSALGYFMSEEELAINWADQELYLIWSCKEALYKWKRGKVSSYKNDLRILEVTQDRIHALVENQYVSCEYLLFAPNAVFVYCRQLDR